MTSAFVLACLAAAAMESASLVRSIPVMSHGRRYLKKNLSLHKNKYHLRVEATFLPHLAAYLTKKLSFDFGISEGNTGEINRISI
jgi:hypothetical protein